MSTPPSITKDDAGIRDNHDPAICHFCRNKIGERHDAKCVCFTKTVTIRLVAEYPIEVPNFWDKGNIEFHRNEGSWCATSAIDELDALFGDGSDTCACESFTFTLKEDRA